MPKRSKKYVVRLTDAERQTLQEVVAKFKGSSQKVRRAQVLLKSDADGPDWTDAKVADAFGCRTRGVEAIRERFAGHAAAGVFQLDAAAAGRAGGGVGDRQVDQL